MREPAGKGTGEEDAAPKRSWRDWYVLALSAGAAVFCLGPSLVGFRTMTSVNFLTDFLPWSAGGNRSVGHQLCQSDIVDSSLPSISYIRHQVFSGHLGSWQSLSAGGGPMAALPNAGLLDPLSLPYWIMPLSWATGFVVLLSWFVAIGGTYLFLRRLRVGRPAATLAGFIFATSGFMVMWTNWPQTRTAALIPALFWATDRVVTRGRLSDLVLLAAVVASMLFGGFPAVTGYALYMAAGYFVIRALFVYRRDWATIARRCGLAAGGLVLGGALSAIQMLPFVDFYRVLNTAYRTGEAKAGLPLGSLVTTFAPNTYGLCVVGKSGAPSDYGATNPIELVAYVGAAALVLAVLGAAFAVHSRRPFQRGVRGYFLGAGAVLILLVWASPSARSAVSGLPVFAGNIIGRARSVFGFAVAVLAAFGFDWLTTRHRGATPADHEDPGPMPGRGSPRWLPSAAWATAVMAVTLVSGLVVLVASHRDASAGHYLHAWKHAIWFPAALLAASAVLAIGAAVFRRRVATLAFVVLPVVAVAQGAYFFHAVMPGDDPRLFYPNTGDHQYLAAHLGHDRFASAGLTLYPATAFYYGLRSPTGHEFTDNKWLELLRAVTPSVMSSATNTDFGGGLNQNTIGRQPVLDQMGVRYAVLPPTELAGTVQPLPPVSGSVTAGAQPLTCSLPGGPVRGVTVKLAAPLTASDPPTYPTVHIRLSSASGTLDSGLYLGAATTPAGTVITLPVAGEDLPVGAPLHVSLWATGASSPLSLAAAGSGAACAALSPRSDGLRLVYAGSGAVIYERLDALPRIRWVSKAVVVAGAGAQIAAVQRGIGASAVVLASPAPDASAAGASPKQTGGQGTVHVTDDSGDRITARVSATSSGYLVVADPMQLPGWSVTVDGHRARLVRANYAMVAVAVPAGTHRVAFTYTAPGQAAGAAVTVIALIAAGLLLWWDRRLAARSRRGPEMPVEHPSAHRHTAAVRHT